VGIDVGYRSAADDQRAGIRAFGPGDDFDERRLARPVFADERMDFAGTEIERHAVERAQTREGLTD